MLLNKNNKRGVGGGCPAKLQLVQEAAPPLPEQAVSILGLQGFSVPTLKIQVPTLLTSGMLDSLWLPPVV